MWVHQQHTGAPKEARHIPHGRCDWSRPDSRQWRTKIREKQRRKQPAKSHPSKKCTQNGCKLTPATHHAHSRPVPDAIMPNHTDGQETPTFEVGEYKQSQALVRQQYAHERGTGEVQGTEWGGSQQLPECNGIRTPNLVERFVESRKSLMSGRHLLPRCQGRLKEPVMQFWDQESRWRLVQKSHGNLRSSTYCGGSMAGGDPGPPSSTQCPLCKAI
jgi:hypothetical protein